MSEKSREIKLRRWATRLGLTLHKSKKRNWTIDDYGGYMIVDPYFNRIEAGQKFDLTLDEVESFLREDEAEKKG